MMTLQACGRAQYDLVVYYNLQNNIITGDVFRRHCDNALIMVIPIEKSYKHRCSESTTWAIFRSSAHQDRFIFNLHNFFEVRISLLF